MQLQKEVKSNPKQPSCKKRCGPPKKMRNLPRNGCDGKLMGKTFNNDNSGEFGTKY